MSGRIELNRPRGLGQIQQRREYEYKDNVLKTLIKAD
jgi:hypothetical protein